MWRGNSRDEPPLPGQLLHFNFNRIGSGASISTENMIDDSSRKRKTTDLEKNGSIYGNDSSSHGGNLIHSIPSQTSSTLDEGRIYVRNRQTCQMHMNRVSSSIQPNSIPDQHGNYPMYDMNKIFTSSQMGHIFHATKKEYTEPCVLQESSASIGNTAVVEIPRLPYSQHFTYNVSESKETSTPHLHSSECFDFTEKNQPNVSSQDGKNLQINYGTSIAPSITSFGNSKSAEFSQKMMFHNKLLCHNENAYEKEQNESSGNAVTRAEYANTNQIVYAAGSQGTVYYRNGSTLTTQLAECATQCAASTFQGNLNDTKTNIISKEAPNCFVSFQTMSSTGDTQLSSGSSFYMSSNSEVKNMDDQNCLDTGKTRNEQEEFLFSTTGTHSSSISQGEGKLVSGKTASPFVGTLWDGNLQLNATTTVSAVAFFKSGEKGTNINWPQYVEVKGKVRLEAFEKFIQELPRSRNRTLMVTSLCWKVGSPETGLTGIKEVAKGYKEGKRVGYAQLSPGIDLYVCPRSETIITILAKYGFFKGLAAVEEDRDSLIGCVVWRRNLTPSISASNKCETKNCHTEKLGNSTSEANPQNAEANSSFTKKQDHEQINTTLCIKDMVGNSEGDESSQTVLVASAQTSSKGDTVPRCADIKTEHSSAVLPIQHNHQVISMQLSNSHYPSTSSPQILEQPKTDLPTPKSPMKCDDSAPRPSTPRKSRNSTDDDDLPEFDFGTARGSHPTVTSQLLSHQVDLSVGPPSKSQEPVSSTPAPSISRPLDVALFWSPSSGCTFSSSQSVALETKFRDGMTSSKNTALTTEVSMPQSQSTSRQIDVALFKAPLGQIDTFSAHQRITPENKIGESMNDRRFPAKAMEAPVLPSSPRSRSMDVMLFRSPSFDYTCSTFEGIGPAQRNGHKNDRCATQVTGTSQKHGILEVEKILVRDEAKSSFPIKNFYDNDDDDDIPEWCPPDLEQHRDVAQLLPSLPLALPPLSLRPYPRTSQAPDSQTMQSSQILEPTADTAPMWPPLSSKLCLPAQRSNDQGLPPYEFRLLGQGSQHNKPRLLQNTGHHSGMHTAESLISQYSGFEVKSDRMPSPGKDPSRNSKLWHSRFGQKSDNSIGFLWNEIPRHDSMVVDANPGQKMLPVQKYNETLRRQHPDILPDHGSSPGFAPKHVLPNHRFSPEFSPKRWSRCQRPSLLDVRYDSFDMVKRYGKH